MPPKQTKVLTKRKKFIPVELPIIRSKIELIANSVEELNNRTIKLDLTRQLKGKSIECIVRIKVENNKASAYPIKIKLMPYFIRRMIRKKISYVEDSFETKTQESLITVKPFLITRNRVSRAVRKTLRNKAKNWITDYLLDKTDSEVFSDIVLNKMQKALSLMLKKTYPLSLCEIRILEIKRALKQEEIPKVEKKEKAEKAEEIIDQLKEIEEEKIKRAEEEIKKTQKIAAEMEKQEEKIGEEVKEISETKPEEQKKKRGRKKKEKIEEPKSEA